MDMNMAQLPVGMIMVACSIDLMLKQILACLHPPAGFAQVLQARGHGYGMDA
jgi:CBS-domain-containing membrane protein